MLLSYNIEIINKISCRIDTPENKGTGILIQLDNDDYMYILTAKHCLLGENFEYKIDTEKININIDIDGNNNFQNIQLDDQDKLIYDNDKMNDTAIIVLKKTESRKVLKSIPKIKLTDYVYIEHPCLFRGYPVPYNNENIEAISINNVSYIDVNKITTITNLDTIYSGAEYNCKGFSGSGVFVKINNEYYLNAIVYEFKEPFKQFPVSKLSDFNTLLDGDFDKLVFNDNLLEIDNLITLKLLKEQFNKAKHGWLDQRYLPNLHGKGIIYKASEQMLGKFDFREKIYTKLNDELYFVINCKKEIEYCLKIFDNNQLENELEKVLLFINDIISNIRIVIKSAEKGDAPEPLANFRKCNLDLCVTLIENQTKKSIYSVNESDLKKYLNTIKQKELDKLVVNIHHVLKESQLIFVGNPGTGKTHGLANAVQDQLEKYSSPALIIQARNYSDSKSWQDILINTLGLSNKWTEEEIWRELEACAERCDINNRSYCNEDNKKLKKELTRVLVCIDGIDEAIPWNNWLERIGELKVITEKYSRLRICISSRPYVFKNYKNIRCIKLADDGDVNAHELFNSYIDEYNVNIKEEETYSWIKWSITTPYALRLFCEKYKNTEITSVNGVSITISHLLAEKIKQIDNEVRKKLGYKWGSNETVIKQSLIIISQYFSKLNSTSKIERYSLCEMLRKDKIISCLDCSDVLNIIDYMVQYGLLYEIDERSRDPLFDESNKYYQIQIQTLMDYLIAMQTIRNFDYENNKGFPEILNDRFGSQQIYALSLLQDKNLLIGENSIWNDYIDKEELFNLQLFALSNASKEKAEKYKDWVIINFKQSMPNCRKIVKNLVAKVSRMKNHPLGPMLVHNILMGYESVAKRDMIWSLPEYIPYNNGGIWEGEGKYIFSKDDLNLNDEDVYNGLPLIFAWQMTSVDNKIRSDSRKQLTMWGQNKPKEFLKLLELAFQSNDPQMKEDLFCCIFGIASKLTKHSDGLKELAEWTINNIFCEDKINDNKNAIIRLAGRAIVERAYMYNLIEDEYVELSRPPYNYENKIAFLNKIAVEKISNSRDGYTPITGDLAWYVIKKGYENFFRIDNEEQEINTEENYLLQKIFQELMQTKNSEVEFESILEKYKNEISEIDSKKEPKEVKSRKIRLSKIAIDFLEQHAESIKQEWITPHQFAIGFGINYIECLGWNRKDFYGSSKGGKKGEILGVDVAISRKYYPATHGSRSAVMTFAEKYTWCAVHEMLGFLADRLPLYFYSDEGEVKRYVKDYFLMLDIPNPIQELEEAYFKDLPNIRSWFIPNELAPTISKYNTDEKENVIGWIKNSPYPEFNSWILAQENYIKGVDDSLSDDWICIHNFTQINEQLTKVESLLWIDSYLINKDEYNLFKKDLESNEKILVDIFTKEHNACFSSPNTNTYIDASSLCWMPWIEDIYAQCTVDSKNGNYKILKCLSQITSTNSSGEEVESIVPSKLMRKIMKIDEFNDWKYYNEDKEIELFYSCVNTQFRETQTLLYAKTKDIKNKIEENNLKMFWCVRILRRPSLKTMDKHKKFFFEKDNFSIVCEEDDKLETYKIHEYSS